MAGLAAIRSTLCLRRSGDQTEEVEDEVETSSFNAVIRCQGDSTCESVPLVHKTGSTAQASR